ncbi:MAG: hypothetical protein ACH350_07335 [Parachlamydiaceae bacterium]
MNLEGRQSSYPYISGDSFRSFCDYVYDEKDQNIKPYDVVYGDVIFVKTDYLCDFFTSVHPKIVNPYILITHNSDLCIPQKFSYLLDDPKIIAWLGQNVKDYKHEKLHPLPIGIANPYWPHGDIAIFKEVQKMTFSRSIPVYMNFSCSTNPLVRTPIFTQFSIKPFCFHSQPKDLRSYLIDVSRSLYVLSPEGNGPDCHRTWEALLMGAIPILTHSSLDPLFEDLPVILVDDWNEVTIDFLNSKWEEMLYTSFNLEKLYADYWFDFIHSFRSKREAAAL